MTTKEVGLGKIFAGDYSEWATFWHEFFKNFLNAIVIELKFEKDDEEGKEKSFKKQISGRMVTALMKILSSTYPVSADEGDDWTMDELIDGQNISNPDNQITEKERIEIVTLTNVYFSLPKTTQQQWCSMMAKELSPFLSSSPEWLGVDTDDVLSIFRLMSTCQENYLKWVKNNTHHLNLEFQEKCNWPKGCSKQEALAFIGQINQSLARKPKGIAYNSDEALFIIKATMVSNERIDVRNILHKIGRAHV